MIRRTTHCLLLILLPSLSLAVESVLVESRLDYNAILITGVDVVFIYDQDLADGFPSSKREWFSGKRQFISAAGDRADVASVFVPQGFSSEMMSLPERRAQAVRVLVMGQHDAPDSAPVDITDFDRVLVEIDQFGIIVSSRD